MLQMEMMWRTLLYSILQLTSHQSTKMEQRVEIRYHHCYTFSKNSACDQFKWEGDILENL